MSQLKAHLKKLPLVAAVHRCYERWLGVIWNAALEISVRRFRPSAGLTAHHLVSVPTVNTMGDALVHYHYTKLLGRVQQRPVYCLSPQVFPSDTYLPLLFGKAEYEFYTEPFFCWLQRRFHRYNRELSHRLLHKLQRRLDALSFYKAGYDERQDPVYARLETNADPAFVRKYAAIRRQDNKIEGWREYQQLLQEEAYVDGRDLNGFRIEEQTQLLQDLGVDRKYVCLHVRLYPREGPYAWDPQRETDPRGIRDFSAYVPLVKYLVARGYQVIRMGTAKEQHEPLSIPGLIDYAHSRFQHCRNDVYLSQACAFFIASKSGLESAASMFRRPVLGLNYACLNSLLYTSRLRFYPKHVVDRQGRVLPLAALLRHPAYFAQDAATYNAFGLRTHDLSGDELLAAVGEFCRLVENPDTDWESKSSLQMQFSRDVGPEHLDLYYTHGAPLDCCLERMREGHQSMAGQA